MGTQIHPSSSNPNTDGFENRLLLLAVALGCIALPILLAGCASTRTETGSDTIGEVAGLTTLARVSPTYQSNGRGSGYWDERGLWVDVWSDQGESEASWLLRGEIQSVNRDWIEVKSIQVSIDGRTTVLETIPTGRSIDELVKGTSCWREQFFAPVDRQLLVEVAHARTVAVRAVGDRDLTDWVPVAEDAKASLSRRMGPDASSTAASAAPATDNDHLPTPLDALAALHDDGIQIVEPWRLTRGTTDWWAGTARRPWPASSTDPIPSEISYFIESSASARIEQLTLEAEVYNPARHGAAMKAEFARLVPMLFSKLGVEMPADLPRAVRREEPFTREMSYGTVTFAREPYNVGHGLALTIRAKD